MIIFSHNNLEIRTVDSARGKDSYLTFWSECYGVQLLDNSYAGLAWICPGCKTIVRKFRYNTPVNRISLYNCRASYTQEAIRTYLAYVLEIPPGELEVRFDFE